MKAKVTPMMQQWHDCKKQSKDALLLFRLGDFYEAFYDDAKTLAKDLELTLTKRGDIPMSGIPAHTVESYIEKLINKGHLIAIAEQVEDPKDVKGIVKREIVKLLSPGCVYNPNLLKDKSHNFFAALHGHKGQFGLSFIDLSTGTFRCAEFSDEKDVLDELTKLQPAELLLSDKFTKRDALFFDRLHNILHCRFCVKEDYHFDITFAESFLKQHFNVLSLDGFGLKDSTLSVMSSGALLTHLQEELCQTIDHVTSLEIFNTKAHMSLDRMTQKNLEIFESQHGSSLFQLVDKTSTPMGARQLKTWVTHPLLEAHAINQRLFSTEELLQFEGLYNLEQLLLNIRDIERLITRISTGYHSPRDIWALKNSLEPVPEIKNILSQLSEKSFQSIQNKLENFQELTHLIEKTLIENPPLKVASGQLIKRGVHQELDKLKNLKENAENFLLEYQEKLKKETGIKTLKVGFNKAFGYFIEVSRLQSKNVPISFHKRQTLVNNERYITEELRHFENDILHAEENISRLEQKIYLDLKKAILEHEKAIRKTAQAIAHLDCLISLTKLAKTPGYVKPLVDESDLLEIKDGRHPTVENADPSLSFVPNDTKLDDKDRLFLITGPNMAGKSTYIRQVALITVMAQIGLFVPASFAHIGLVDKIFTRIGANDDLAKGQSTFMVEMTETANILNNATTKSLVILDEIGRGTSTYDGISIAWSVAEYLLTCPTKRAKTLFATHYFELTAMEKQIEGAVNYNVLVKETPNGITFLRKIQKGQADKSYGIHVAKLAGLPSFVISKAKKILKDLEQGSHNLSPLPPSSEQLSLFQDSEEDELAKDFFNSLKDLDLDNLSPMQAFELIRELKSKI